MTPPVETKQPESIDPPIIATMMEREKPVKKCCNIMKEDVHIAGKCCAYSWCFTLNGIECCCVGLSKLCICFSDMALCCNNCLEQIDCDKH